MDQQVAFLPGLGVGQPEAREELSQVGFDRLEADDKLLGDLRGRSRDAGILLQQRAHGTHRQSAIQLCR